MVSAKDIIIKVIPSNIANDFVKKHHYSGKVVNNSQLHFGAFLDGRLHGVMSFGPSLDKRKIQGLVKGTGWNEFIELNRMAFDDFLPKNSESRCIAVAMKLLKKNAPQIKWVISFADGCQCGDGTIYRASGFLLTQINSHTENWKLPNGETVQACTLRQSGYTSWLSPYISKQEFDKIRSGATSSVRIMKHIGAEKVNGFQLRYIYFIDKTQLKNLTVPIIPFSKIDELGAGMYKGEKITIEQRAFKVQKAEQPDNHQDRGGANPT